MRERQAADQPHASSDANPSRNKEFYDRNHLSNTSPAVGINKNIIEVLDVDEADSGKLISKLEEIRLRLQSRKLQINNSYDHVE
jgi:division protein CdvB (Snf7/Vps24/ESCRT-III family)